MRNKTIISIIIVIVIIGLVSIIYFIISNNNKQNQVIDTQEQSEDISNIEEKIEEQPKEEIYKDDNKIKIGLYVGSGNTKKLVTDYYSYWHAEEIMGMFYAVPTQEETITGTSFKEMWEGYFNQYENSKNYRIGYNIKFTLDTGEVIDQIILNPDHAYLMFPKLQFYLYDDVNLVPGKGYYHITQDVMYDYTQCTSVKLVGDKKTDSIVSPIELTVFTFNDEDDFDKDTGKYRGNSSYTIKMYRK